MQRKRAIAVALSAAIISGTGAVALGANFGLFGLGASAASAPSLPISKDGAPPATTPSGPPSTEVQYVDVPMRVAVPSGGSINLPTQVTAEDHNAAESPTETTLAPAEGSSTTSTTASVSGSSEHDHEDGQSSTSTSSTNEQHRAGDD